MPPRSSSLAAADRNFCDSNTVFFANSHAGETLDSAECQLVSCGFPIADFNALFLRRIPEDIEATLESARAFFEPRSLPYLVTMRDEFAGACAETLGAHGFRELSRVPGMLLDPIRRAPDALPDLEVREVRTPEELESFGRIAFAGFGLPLAAAPLFMTDALREVPQLTMYLGFVDGEAACSSALVQTGKIAGVYWVATLDAFRRRGLGAAITWAAVDGGRERGCRTASLQASVMGEPVYQRMGFATPMHYVRFGRADAASA